MTLELEFRVMIDGNQIQGLFNLRGNGVVFGVDTASVWGISGWINSTQVTELPGSTITMGEWYHLAVVLDASETRMYLDGVIIYTGPASNTTGPNAYIGSSGGALGLNGSAGDINNAIISNYAKYTADFTPPTADFATTCAGDQPPVVTPPGTGDGYAVPKLVCTPIYDPASKPIRLIAQYRNSPQLKDFIKLYEDQILGEDSVLNCFNDLSIFFCIDSASGEWLDIIGEIVGQPRFYYPGEDNLFFGFREHFSAAGFGSEDAPTGGYWYDEQQPLPEPILISDAQYKYVIRARILLNHHTGTVNNTIAIFETLFNAPVQVTDMSGDYTVIIGKILEPIDETIIQQTDLTPNVLGFRRNIAYGNQPYFAFAGSPNAAGFDEGTWIATLYSIK